MAGRGLERPMRAWLALSVLLLPLSGCSSAEPAPVAAPLAEADPGAAEAWNVTASRDVRLDGMQGEACRAVAFLVPDGTSRLYVLAAAPLFSGNGVLEPEGVGYIRARLFGPDGAEVPLEEAPSHDPLIVHAQPYGYEAEVQDPAVGEWSMRVEPNQANVMHRARVAWEMDGTGVEPDGRTMASRDADC